MNGAENYLSEAVSRARDAARSDLQVFGNFFLSRFFRLQVTYDDDQQTCTVSLPYARYLSNPQGSVHGGVIATAMDISMGHLCHRFLSTALTIEMQVRYFRPLTGDGKATGRIINAGRRLVHLESRMTGPEGNLIAHGVSAWHRLDSLRESAPDR